MAELTTKRAPAPLTGGTMIDELSYARRRVPELEAQLAAQLPVEHYLNNLHQELLLTADDSDFETAQLAVLALEALDVVVATRQLIDERLDDPEGEAVAA